MPFGLGWLVDVRDYFMRAPVAMIIVVIALHFICRRIEKSSKDHNKYID